MYHHSLQVEIRRSLEKLNKMEKEVICFFFGIDIPHPYSLHEISGKYNLTPERIRQIKDKALTKLRNPKKAELLRSYLGN
jgi:RNA polymerase primary sigma factor